MRRRLLAVLVVLAVAAAAATTAVVLLASTNGDARIGRLSPLAQLHQPMTTPAPASAPPGARHHSEDHHDGETSDD
jgi:hypothetical protein